MRTEPPSHMVLMDRVYRRQRYFYDVTRRYYLVGRDRLLRELALRPGQSAVEVGCGTARNLIAMARRYPGAHFFGLDASALMLETAAKAVARAGLSDRIVLVRGYAENLSPELFGRSNGFDRAVFSYSLSMISDWRRALAAAGGALAPGGRLHIVDFGDFRGLGRIGAAALRLWLRHFYVEPRSEILQTLETTPQGRGDAFWIAPGRYAFLWSTNLNPGPLTNVAGPPQESGNP